VSTNTKNNNFSDTPQNDLLELLHPLICHVGLQHFPHNEIVNRLDFSIANGLSTDKHIVNIILEKIKLMDISSFMSSAEKDVLIGLLEGVMES